MWFLCLLSFLICATNISGFPRTSQKIVGGQTVWIEQYPFMTALLYTPDLQNYFLSCGGTVLTTSAILTAAHCVYGDAPNRWRARVGTHYASAGGYGTSYLIRQIIVNPDFDYWTLDYDVAVLRTTKSIVYSDTVGPAVIAGGGFDLPDNSTVWAVGWGATATGGSTSENLRHVQVWTVNQSICAARYKSIGMTVTDNMLCSGWLDVGGRDQCQGDSGGPLVHFSGTNVIVGVCSWGQGCGDARYPGVNTRVSKFTAFIQSAAMQAAGPVYVSADGNQ